MLSIIKNSMIKFSKKKNNVMVTLDHHITQTISKIKILNSHFVETFEIPNQSGWNDYYKFELPITNTLSDIIELRVELEPKSGLIWNKTVLEFMQLLLA